MQTIVTRVFWRTLRVCSLIVLAMFSTVALVRYAPGYFTDSQELDAQHGSVARAALTQQRLSEGSVGNSLQVLVMGWVKGDFGTSRQFDVPVSQLVHERATSTGKLLVKAVLLGWTWSFSAALLLCARWKRTGESMIAMTSAALLCIPIALMATLCLATELGGPVFVLASIVAIRDFKLLYRVLSNGVRSPAIVFARAQGYSFSHAVRIHLLQALKAEFISLLVASLVVALSAVVPVEVIFDRPGLGQLAWSSAMNRDLPTLLAVIMLMATLIGVASMIAEPTGSQELSTCA